MLCKLFFFFVFVFLAVHQDFLQKLCATLKSHYMKCSRHMDSSNLSFEFFRDLEKYDVELLFSQNMDYEKAFAMTSELIVLEIFNRVFICIFEVSDLCYQLLLIWFCRHVIKFLGVFFLPLFEIKIFFFKTFEEVKVTHM